MHTDSDQRRLADLERELRFYKAFADNAVEGMFRATPEGRYVYANAALARIYGYDSVESLVSSATAASLYVDPVERAEQRRLLEEHGEVRGFEAKRRRKDGSIIWASGNLRAVRDAEGRLLYTEGTVADITQRKTLQEQMGLAAKDAEEARAQAAAANRAKSEFLSRMSHELRTPLNAILGFAQLLEMEDLSTDQRESVEHILKGGRHLLRLINEVLDIARVEAGRMVLSLEPVPVANVIDEAVDLAKPIAAGQQIDLQVSTPGQPLWAVADAGRLKQVVLNLLSNALKYNRPGGKATVSWGIDAQGSPEISVSDTGFGIAPEKLARLFQPFDRLGAEATGIEGTGLGLALSKGLVEAMGGNIAARSTPGLGSTFTVTLPPAEDPAQAPIAEPASPNGHVAAFGQRTILYVEDNLANLRLMERVISRYPSLRLVPAMQGRLALELVRTADPDLILLDLNLPDMPGEAVLEEVLREPGQRRVPIIVISAEASPRHVQRLVDSGADAYITKPIDVSHVIGLLEEFLGPTSAPYRRDQQRSNEAGPHSPGG